MLNIIVKNYEHFNKALPNWDSPQGKYIGSKAQYDKEMKKGGFEQYDGKGRYEQKKWKPSDEVKRDLYQLKQMSAKDGRIDPVNREAAKRLMEKNGIRFNPKIMSSDLKGGVDASR